VPDPKRSMRTVCYALGKKHGEVSILGYTNKLHGRALEEKSQSACASFKFIIASKQY